MEKKKLLVHAVFNRLLDILTSDSGEIPSELSLSKKLAVSRTVIRKAFELMVARELIRVSGRRKKLVRSVQPSDYFDIAKDSMGNDQIIEQFFIDQMKNGALRPGVKFSVLELATDSGCNRTIVREFLLKFSRFGLIEKLPRKMWGMVKIDRDYMRELTDTRKILELGALNSIWSQPDSAPIWLRLDRLSSRFEHMIEGLECSANDASFWELDKSLHQSMIDCRSNRFISRFYANIYFMFTLHFQWCLSEGTGFTETTLAQDIELLNNIILRHKKEVEFVISNRCENWRELFCEAVDMLNFP